jgi:hypothetical protein
MLRVYGSHLCARYRTWQHPPQAARPHTSEASKSARASATRKDDPVTRHDIWEPLPDMLYSCSATLRASSTDCVTTTEVSHSLPKASLLSSSNVSSRVFARIFSRSVLVSARNHAGTNRCLTCCICTINTANKRCDDQEINAALAFQAFQDKLEALNTFQLGCVAVDQYPEATGSITSYLSANWEAITTVVVTHCWSKDTALSSNQSRATGRLRVLCAVSRKK